MAQKSIQIADKPTLDAAKALLEDSGVGLAAIKEAVSSGAASGSAGGLFVGKQTGENVGGNASVSTLPYKYSSGSAVVLNGEIHILGGSGNGTNHYKFNGTSWESVSTLPCEWDRGSAVILNNEIHILGGSASNTKCHYKFNGESWVKSVYLPYEFVDGDAIVLDEVIQILGGNNHYTNHYSVKDNCRNITAVLPKGTHVLMPDNMDIKYVSDNAVISANNIIEVVETGIVEVVAYYTDPDNMLDYLTFY